MTAPEANEPPATASVAVLLSGDRQLADELARGLARQEPAIELHVIANSALVADHTARIHPELVILDLSQLESAAQRALLSPRALSCGTIVLLGPPAPAILPLIGQLATPLKQVAEPAELLETISRALSEGRRVLLDDRRFRETVQHYRDILEASSDGIFVLLGGVFSYANESFAHALGQTTAALVGQQSLLDLTQEEDRVMLAEELARLSAGGGKREVFELGLHRADGELRRFEIACRSSVVDGRRTVVGVARDVTAVRELQDEIERARQRGAQIERLRALGEMAAGVAHDFNNALEAILGRVGRAREKLERGESPADDLAIVEQAARNAVETVHRIRDFARPVGEESWHDVNLEAVVRDVGTLVNTRIPPGIELSVQTNPTPRLSGNAAELHEALLNLLTNAIDAVTGPGRVELRCFAEDGLAVVEVSDTGCGMPAEVQRRLYEPFFTTKGEAGTGLGLSVAHGILRRHDAEVQLDSVPGRGTTFRLMFCPLAAPPAPTHAPAGDAWHILVVDDDETVGELMGDLLLELGHRVSLASTAGQALALLAEHSVDLLITDLDLAETSGWQLARQARRQYPELLIGMVTGWPLGASTAEIKRRGVDFVIAKPFSLDTLVEALAELRR